MNLSQTANRLALATNDEARSAVWHNNGANSVLEMAYALKELCLNDGWSSNPARCVGAAAALSWLSRTAPQAEVYALCDWCEGLAAVAHGRYAAALQLLGQAERRWQELGRPHTAAETQVVALYALAMLGRYDEAVECGLQARDIFLAHDDALAAGKIENNLGNIYFRRDLYHSAEHFQSLARQRFTDLRHTVQLAKINNCLANTHAHLHRFASAEQLYAEAWAAAQTAGLTLTQAEIAGNRGNLALFQSRYDSALDWLEQSRRHYVALKLPHQATLTELEIADIYLELNLLPEAVELYRRVAPTFAALGMRAEQARTLAQHGQAVTAAGPLDEARTLLDQAQQLYLAEENSVGAAAVTLNVAHWHYARQDFLAAQRAATLAAWVLRRSGNRRRWLAARWLCGETARAAGQNDRAQSILHAVLRAAETHAQPHIVYRCRVGLGLLARATARAEAAATHFTEAVEIAETLRAILPAEEFRAAFVADKLTPYNELMRLALAADDADAAFAWAERARARTLTERLTRRASDTSTPPAADAFTQQAHTRLAQLRTELHWFYSLLEHPATADAPRRAWQEAVRLRERETLEIARRLRHKNSGQWSAVSGQKPENSGQWSAVGGQKPENSGQRAVGRKQAENSRSQVSTRSSSDEPQPAFQNDLLPLTDHRPLTTDHLPATTALIEYAALDDELLAFVVTSEKVTVVRGLGPVSALQNLVERLRFQLRAARYGRTAIAAHQTQLIERTRFYLRALYDRILAPVVPHAPHTRWVIVPHGVLHYVPFHALYDGTDYLLASRAIVTSPSATLWQHCRNQPPQPFDKALLIGVGDDRAPLVNAEIAALAPLFAESETLLEAAATLPALRRRIPAAGVLHWAGHGQFRPDNPLFSTLRLGDGWLTVREAETLPLSGQLVTLSACETGVQHIAPGEELTGLAQGFFAAGARSLLLSLWTVDDAAATALMTDFYRHLHDGLDAADALRTAQLALLQQHPHPFYWSPFVLAGA